MSRILVQLSGCSKRVGSLFGKHSSPLIGAIGSAAISETRPRTGDSGSTSWKLALDEANRFLENPDIIPTDKFQLLSDKLEAVGGINHRLLNMAKNKDENDRHARGLILLLWSKGMAKSEGRRDPNLTVKEHYIATSTELLYMALRIHSSVADAQDAEAQKNKYAILIGDLMVTKSLGLLSKVENAKAYRCIMKAIGDYMQGEFVFGEDGQGLEYPTETSTFRKWETRTFLRSASLLANAFNAVHLVNDTDELSTTTAYSFAKNLGMAWKASLEVRNYLDVNGKSQNVLSLVSLPVILHLENDPQLIELIEPHHGDLSLVDYEKLYKEVCKGQAIEKARNICNEFVERALQDLSELEQSDSRNILHKIVSSLKV